MTTAKKKEKEDDQPRKVYKPPVPPPPSPKGKKAKQSKEKKAKQPKEKKEDQPSNDTKEDQPTDTKEEQPKATNEEQQIDETEDQPKKVKKVKQPKEKKAKQPQDTKEHQPTDTCTKEDQPTDTKEDQTTDSCTKEDQPKDETEDQLTNTKEEQPEQPKDEKENQPNEDEKDDQQQPKDNEVPIDDDLEKLKNNDMSFRSLNLVLHNDMDFVKLRKAMKGNTAVYQVQLQVDPYFMKWDEMQPLFKTMGTSLEGLKYLCLGNATTAAVCFSVIPIDALAALLKKAGTKLRWLYVCGVRFTHHVAPDAPPSPTRSPTRSSPEDAEGETGPGGDENKAIRKAFGKLGDAFQAASNLTKMSMMCQLDDVLVSAGCTLDPIVNAMGKMYSLETAVLCVEPSKPDKMDRIQVGDKALKHLFQCPSLKQLRILSLDFDASHIKAIATGLSDDEAALEEVFISANNTATEPCGASVGALFRAASCKLKQLTMEEYKFEDEGLVAMSIALATGGDHRMEELDISCRMQRMGSLAMSQMLMVNKSLKKLRLHDMEFDNDESPLELIKGLAGTKAAKNSTLDTLELAGRFRQDVDEEKIKELHSKKKFSSTVTKEMDTEKEADAEKEADTEKEADAEKEAEEPAGPTTCIRIERILEKDSKDKTDSV